MFDHDCTTMTAVSTSDADAVWLAV